LLGTLFAGATPGAGMTGPDPAVLRRLESRKLVLEHKLEDIKAYKRVLGKADQLVIDTWLASLAEIQSELTRPAAVGMTGGCEAPNLGAKYDVNANENHPKLLKAEMDLAVAALASDTARIAMLEIDDQFGSNVYYTWLGADFGKTNMEDLDDAKTGNNGHSLAHQNQDKKRRVDGWMHGQFAYLIDRLMKIKEGDGTLLDNTLVVITNDGRCGGFHTTHRVPWLLAGGKNMGFKRGRYLPGNNQPKGRLLTTLAQAMGANLGDFGGHAALVGLR
jgi:hypothetical protein